jgi:undecaprenyl-diphosphatase
MARIELGLLLALLGLAGGTLGFVQIADEVVEGETEAFDRAVFLAFRHADNPSLAIGPAWLPEMARDITALGSFGVLSLVLLIVLGYLVLTAKRAAALLVLVAVVGGQIVSTLMKLGFERARPDLVPNAPQVFTASFPSGHAMLSAVTYLTIGALLMRVEADRRARIYVLGVAVILTLLVGLSRVYLGVHWPTDVLAGWSVGAAWAMLCWLVALWMQREGQIEPPRA